MPSLKYDGDVTISTAGSRWDKRWKNKTLNWSELLDKLSTTTRTRETVAEYKKLSKTKQDAIKDVGGFVGGWLQGGQRKADHLEHRSMITLDADFAEGTDLRSRMFNEEKGKFEEREEVVQVEREIYIQPDMKAAALWLTNRNRDRWAEHPTPQEGEQEKVTVIVDV